MIFHFFHVNCFVIMYVKNKTMSPFPENMYALIPQFHVIKYLVLMKWSSSWWLYHYMITYIILPCSNNIDMKVLILKYLCHPGKSYNWLSCCLLKICFPNCSGHLFSMSLYVHSLVLALIRLQRSGLNLRCLWLCNLESLNGPFQLHVLYDKNMASTPIRVVTI